MPKPPADSTGRDGYWTQLARRTGRDPTPPIERELRTPEQRRALDEAGEADRTAMLRRFQERPYSSPDGVDRLDPTPSPDARAYERAPTAWMRAYARAQGVTEEQAVAQAQALGLRLDLPMHRFQERRPDGTFKPVKPSAARIYELTRSLDPAAPTTAAPAPVNPLMRSPARAPQGPRESEAEGFISGPDNPLVPPKRR